MNNIKKRIYLKNQHTTFDLFSIEQNSNDSSIYLFSKAFKDLRFFTLEQEANGFKLLSWKPEKHRKMSLHGSGISHIKYQPDPLNERQLSVKGHYLKNDKNEMGVKHLFTIFPSHDQLSNSKLKNEKEAYIITSEKTLEPTAFVFFAVPIVSKKLIVEFSCKMHADNMLDGKPPIGWGMFELSTHHVLWFSYSLSHIKKWPARTLVSFFDGVYVPFFTNLKKTDDLQTEGVDLSWVIPSYKIVNFRKEQLLRIQIPKGAFDVKL